MIAPENPAAFPLPEGERNYCQEGMSLRDWFAGQMLVAIGCWVPGPGSTHTPGSEAYHQEVQEGRAVYAYQQADAMLAARVSK